MGYGMNVITKKQLRHEKTLLESLISRYGSATNLSSAHDNVSIALDYFRGDCVRRRKKIHTELADSFFELTED